jgi:NAD(P)-dependent dehydrogenase (short-subunit alcohol dehydrogenase family)
MKARTALVTGASRGIGRAIAAELQRRGMTVLTPARSELDLGDDASIARYAAGLAQTVTVLVNDAGVNFIAPLESLEDGKVRETLQVNLLAPLRLIRLLAPAMAKEGYGRIVNISSIFSVVSRPGRVSYSISKAGLDALTRSLALELAPRGILVNGVAPGYVDTELTRRNNAPGEIRRIEGTIPLGRLARVDEIAALVGFLCSEENGYLTGQTILVDGGYTCA